MSEARFPPQSCHMLPRVRKCMAGLVMVKARMRMALVRIRDEPLRGSHSGPCTRWLEMDMLRTDPEKQIMRPILLLSILALVGFTTNSVTPLAAATAEKIRVILDTDANNELDDQHAIAYLLFNGHVFDVEGITVNRTRAGGDVHQHYAEAARVVELCGLKDRIKVYLGADGAFNDIKGQLDRPDFDGAEAVNLIIERAREESDQRRLVLLPVGKLTNIALALAKAPDIASKVRVVWLGSNYPEPGEYNQVNDEPSLNYILETGVDFEIAIVRYGKPSGTDAVRATLEEIRRIMPGKGPQVVPPVKGRHGGNSPILATTR
jgi:purine nucleosidase